MKKLLLILALLISICSFGQGGSIYYAPVTTGATSQYYVGASKLVSGRPKLFHIRLDSIFNNAVSSVFGRTGAVTAQSGDYTWAQIGSKPTTLSTFGITDGISNSGNQTITGGLTLSTTTATFNPPSLTNTQKFAVSSPTAGSAVYDNSLNKLSVYDGEIWNEGDLSSTSWGSIMANNAASFANFGLSATTTGTATARNPATTNFFTKRKRVGLVSAASTNSVAAIRHATPIFTIGDGFFCVMTFGISSAAYNSAHHAAAVLSSSSTAFTDGTEPSTFTNQVGIVYNSTQTNWRAVSNDGTTSNIVDLGANYPTNTVSTDWYELTLICAPGASSVTYILKRLNTSNIVRGTLSSNLPASTTLLSPQIWIGTNTSSAAVAIDVQKIFIKTTY